MIIYAEFGSLAVNTFVFVFILVSYAQCASLIVLLETQVRKQLRRISQLFEHRSSKNLLKACFDFCNAYSASVERRQKIRTRLNKSNVELHLWSFQLCLSPTLFCEPTKYNNYNETLEHCSVQDLKCRRSVEFQAFKSKVKFSMQIIYIFYDTFCQNRRNERIFSVFGKVIPVFMLLSFWTRMLHTKNALGTIFFLSISHI